MSWDIINFIMLFRILSKLVLNISRNGTFATPLGNLLKYFTTLIMKNFFFIASLHLDSFGLKPHCPISIWC